MRRVLKYVSVGLALLLLVLAGAAAVARWWWVASVPDLSGSRQLPGLSGEVSVAWDPHGVPTIEARSFEDALAAEGYLHALLRPVQVELRRRSVAGGLAAVAGPALVPFDEEALEAGFETDAAREEATLAPDVRRAVEAYVRGINEGLAEASRRPQPGLRVARIDARPWTARDAIAFGRRFASTLSDAEYFERARLDLLLAFGPDDAAALWQAAYGEPFPPVPEGTRALLAQAGRAVKPAASRPLRDDEPARASNGWAVSPGRSATGGALLAGDPHLDYELPTTWFEVRMRWPGGELAGASLAGAPGVIIGHNARVAWTFTVAAFDDADLFLVRVDDVRAPTRYREGDAFKPFTLEEHDVEVRGEKPRHVTVRRAGPAVYAGPSGIDGYGLLLRQASRETGGLLAALAGIDRARNVDEALAAGRAFPGPGQNLVVADADGTIAHAILGAAPERNGSGWDGRVPAPWTGSSQWSGFVPRDAMPSERNPSRGYVFNANEAGIALAPAPGQRALTGDYEVPWRAARLAERLADLPHASPADVAALQLDAHGGFAAELQELVRACRLGGPEAETYLGWDGVSRGPGPALLGDVFRGALAARIRNNTRLGGAGGAFFARLKPMIRLLRAADTNPWIADWLDDPATAWAETPCDHVQRALRQAWSAVRAAAGPDPSGWTWERWHLLALHSPLAVGPLADLFDPPPVGVAGTGDALLATHTRLAMNWNGQPQHVVHGPSYRMVAAFDAKGALTSSSALPGGEFEHPRSAHAFDRLDGYARGVLDPLVPEARGAEPPLHLTPAR